MAELKTLSPYQRWVKPRLENDPEFRGKLMKRNADYHKRRCQTDPEFKARGNEYSKQSHKNRYANDPEYRERKLEQMRIYREKKKALKLQQSN